MFRERRDSSHDRAERHHPNVPADRVSELLEEPLLKQLSPLPVYFC